MMKPALQHIEIGGSTWAAGAHAWLYCLGRMPAGGKATVLTRNQRRGPAEVAAVFAHMSQPVIIFGSGLERVTVGTGTVLTTRRSPSIYLGRRRCRVSKKSGDVDTKTAPGKIPPVTEQATMVMVVKTVLLD